MQMATESVLEKWSGEVSVVNIGATKEEGGSRSHAVKVGGQKAMPYLFQEGAIPNKPVIAYEIWDVPPVDWPQELVSAYGAVLKDPFAWAQKCVREYKAELLCVRLQGAHPEFGNKTASQEADFIRALLKKVSVPLIIIGSGDDTKDNQILPACCEAAKGERCLVGSAVQDNYKTLAAAVLADGHNIIAESPIDINIAKQLNILISDMSLPLERIVINPTIGALGYGLEYAYSIMERSRLAALAGDKTVASPFICFIGQESWRAKEAWMPAAEMPQWGPQAERGIVWEMVTATALIQAGADILVMRHPKAAEKIDIYIQRLMAGK
jgi:acetyl-CoA decarbonylase/synthase, CODH/ACS complex subunit delta